MANATGRRFMATPGPSSIPDRVLQAMHRDAPSIYEGEIVEETERLVPRLRRIAGTEGEIAMYAANGHGAWEAALVNTLGPGDRALALYTGGFTRNWAQLAKELGLEVVELDFGTAGPIDANRIADYLRGDCSIRAVLMAHTDTSTSVLADVGAVRHAIDVAGSTALLIVDCIASFGCDRLEMDSCGVDVVITASQKGLMAPPGISMNFFGQRARAARAKLDRVSPYWDWQKRVGSQGYYQMFFGTAPTNTLFGLCEATRMIEEEGLENVWHRHQVVAASVHAAVACWGVDGPLALNVALPSSRSTAVTTVRCPGVDVANLRRLCETAFGVTLGTGFPMSPATVSSGEPHTFRIGHMGHVNTPTILAVLGSIQTALEVAGISYGRGALSAAAHVLAAGWSSGAPNAPLRRD